MSAGKALAGLAAAVAAVCVLAAFDYARPPSRQTHLGRFVGEVLHGGAWTVVRRKAVADFDLLTHSVLTLLVPVLVVAAIILVRRPPGVLRVAFEHVPVLRPTLIAVLVMSVVASVVNDSGAAVPALVILVVVPAVMSVVASGQDPEEPVPELLP